MSDLVSDRPPGAGGGQRPLRLVQGRDDRVEIGLLGLQVEPPRPLAERIASLVPGVTVELYKIEDGKVGAPVKGATLIGNGPDVLTRVSMVGNDLELDAGIGVCGKEGQSVPVGVGQPTLKIDELTVGE